MRIMHGRTTEPYAEGLPAIGELLSEQGHDLGFVALLNVPVDAVTDETVVATQEAALRKPLLPPTTNIAYYGRNEAGQTVYFREAKSGHVKECAHCHRDIEPWMPFVSARFLDENQWLAPVNVHMSDMDEIEAFKVDEQRPIKAEHVTDDRLNKKQLELLEQKRNAPPNNSGIPKRRFHVFGPNGAQHIVPVDKD